MGATPPADGGAEVWVEIHGAADVARAKAAGLGFAEGSDGDWVRFVGDPAAAEAAGLRWRPDTKDEAAFVPDPDDVDAAIRALGGEIVELGVSRDGERILAVRLGDGPRAVRVLAGHHGDEGSSIVVAVAVARALAERGVPAGTEVWVVPVVNPDGARAQTRENALGVDLNRNYGWAWDPTAYGAGAAAFSEPETRAIRAFARSRDFVGGLTLHSGSTNIGWVWNWSTEVRPVEEALLAELAGDYAAECGAPGFWTTNGADWYVTHGDTTDWTYGALGAYDYTLELTEVKAPPESEAPTYVGWHLDAILDFVERPPDREAVVTDAVTGEPIPARVTGADVGDGWTGPDGRYARWGVATDLVASAPGYAEAPLGEPLVPVSLVARASRLVSRGAGEVAIDGAGTLSMPGEADVAFDGAIDPSLLAPGAWTVTTDEGSAPRSLFVGEVDDRVAILDASLDGEVLTLDGQGFGEGAEAWSIGGAARAMHALPRVSEAEDELVFTLAEDDDDVVVWTSGAWLSVVDVRGEPQVDTGAPDWDPPDAEEDPVATDESWAVPGGCGGDLRYVAGVVLVGIGRRRR